MPGAAENPRRHWLIVLGSIFPVRLQRRSIPARARYWPVNRRDHLTRINMRGKPAASFLLDRPRCPISLISNASAHNVFFNKASRFCNKRKTQTIAMGGVDEAGPLARCRVCRGPGRMANVPAGGGFSDKTGPDRRAADRRWRNRYLCALDRTKTQRTLEAAGRDRESRRCRRRDRHRGSREGSCGWIYAAGNL